MSAPFLFINYRQKDTAVLADNLSTELRGTFGEDVVFLDNSDVEKGQDFPPQIQLALDRCTCMLVLFGEKWLFQHDEESGKRRLDMEEDWVRREIETAFQSGIDVIPVLAPGAKLPKKKDLPASIQSLVDRIAVPLRAESYVLDRQGLLEELAANHGFVKRSLAVDPPDRSTDPSREEAACRVATSENATADHQDQSGPTTDQQNPQRPKAWMNGTQLHYFFFDQQHANADVVRQAFATWKGLGIGLDFEEVGNAEDAEIRIDFQLNQGAWSYVGRDALNLVATDQATMNFGWELVGSPGLDTALHEVGHALGLSHEHQNPHSGIEWNVAAVYELFGGPPNNWSREQVDQHVLLKGSSANFYGPWDPDSIMHHPFPEGLINKPTRYQSGLTPAGGLSDGDVAKIRFLYPPLTVTFPELHPLDSASLMIQPGEQGNYTVLPRATGEYRIQTFGNAEVVMMLFQDDQGRLRTLEADDNSNQGRCARLQAELIAGGRYVLRIRLFQRQGDAAVMMWSTPWD